MYNSDKKFIYYNIQNNHRGGQYMDPAQENFVKTMLEKAKNKDKPAPQGRTNADPKEVEAIMEKIQREIQQKK
jgi:hypothetical protein